MRVTGSLQEKNGVYQMVVRVPDLYGANKQKSKSTKVKVKGKNHRESTANKHKAELMLAEWMDELSRLECFGSDRDLIAAIEDWLKQKKKAVREDTFESYSNMYRNHIKPFFAPKKLRLGDVTPRIIMTYVRQKEDAGQSRRSIRHHMVILNGVFSEAIMMGELLYNPCTNIKIKAKNGERFAGTAYDVPTAKKLLDAVKDDPIEPAVYLALYLGLRRSEACGLRWKDVDMESGLVHIRNTIVCFSEVREKEQTKTHASRRDLYLPNALKAYLQTVWVKQEADRDLTGREYSEDEHICQWPDGSILLPDYISRRFAKILKKNKLPKIRFHDLRHTAGSLLVNSGHTIKQVQEFLGHENASTTLDIYTHISSDNKKDTALAMDKLLA